VAGEIDEGAAGFLEYQSGLSSRMGEKVEEVSMRAVQCKLGSLRVVYMFGAREA